MKLEYKFSEPLNVTYFYLLPVCYALSSVTHLFPIFQFEDIGPHGTKILIYNLWLNDEGIYELSFDDDDEVCSIYNYFIRFFLWICINYKS